MSQNSRERMGKVVALRDRAANSGAADLGDKPAGGWLKPTNAALSDSIIKKLPEPEKGSKIHYDPALPGFGIRVTAAGARS